MFVASHRRTLIAASALMIAMGSTSGVLTLASPDHGHSTPAPAATSPAGKTTKSNTTSSGTSNKADRNAKPKGSTTPGDEPAVVSMPSKPRAKNADEHGSHGDEAAQCGETNGEHNTTATKNEKSEKNEKGENTSDSESSSKATKAKAESESAPLNAQQALKMLKDGNARWVAGNPTAPNSDASRRRVTATDGQNPFVTVVTCADSRCPVERLFDRGVGDVFVSRIAGNVIGNHAAGTIEYGVEHLHTPLVVVMGHTSCGAVKAAAAGAKPGHNINSLISEITPAVVRAQAANPGASDEQIVNAAIRENVYQSMFELLKTSPMTAKFVQEGKVELVGAVYDISTGKVEFLGTHPWQTQLLEAMLPRTDAATTATANAEQESSH